MRKMMEERLIDFAVSLNKLCESLLPGLLSKHLTDQILRSGTSAILNYAESQSAESKKDFIHKSSIVLKELRETHCNLKIMYKSGICINSPVIDVALAECNQLVAIFHKSVQTAKKNYQIERIIPG